MPKVFVFIDAMRPPMEVRFADIRSDMHTKPRLTHLKVGEGDTLTTASIETN
jgi:hypothetical protein